jgi:uncharacterized protein (TIGR02117 family)
VKPARQVDKSKSVEELNTLYIVRHGWHTGIVIPSYQITSVLPSLRQRFGDMPFIEFGWGDKGFYQSKKVTAKLALKAMFIPTESVIHAVGVQDSPALYFSESEVVKLCLNAEENKSLIAFVAKSFLKHDNKIIATKDGIYGDSQFYQAQGDYYLMNTCNKWTAKGLSSAGFDISTTFKLSANSVMRYLHKQKTGESCY